jgi:hypothetical protein
VNVVNSPFATMAQNRRRFCSCSAQKVGYRRTARTQLKKKPGLRKAEAGLY